MLYYELGSQAIDRRKGLLVNESIFIFRRFTELRLARGSRSISQKKQQTLKAAFAVHSVRFIYVRNQKSHPKRASLELKHEVIREYTKGRRGEVGGRS